MLAIHNEKMKTCYDDYKDENLGYFITPKAPTFIIKVLLTNSWRSNFNFCSIPTMNDKEIFIVDSYKNNLTNVIRLTLVSSFWSKT